MAHPHWNEEWRQQNSQIKYPFSDMATLTNGTDQIDVSLLVDARLYPVGGSHQQYVSKIVIDGSNVSFYIANSGSSTDIAVATYDTNSVGDVINVVDTAGNPAGVLVGDQQKLIAMKSWADGVHSFSYQQTAFAASVLVPIPQNNVGALVVDGEVFTGDVWLVGENGCVLSYEDGQIRVDFVGDAYYALRYCWNEENGTVIERNPIKTINGISPNSRGDIFFSVGDNFAERPVLRISNRDNGIEIATVGTTGVGSECD